MPDLKISQLTAGSLAQAGDEIPIARSGANYKITGADIAAAATSVGTLSSLTVSGDVTVDTSTLKVDSANNRVGIGTASPAALLDVSGYARLNGSGADVGLVFARSGTTYGQLTTSGTNILEVRDGSFVSRAVVDASGNLGVGAASLFAKFTVADASNGRLEVSPVAGGVNTEILDSTRTNAADFGSYGKEFFWQTKPVAGSYSEKMRLDASGNLGIGGSPSYKLHLVSGSAADIETGVTNSAGYSRFGTRGSGNSFVGAFTAGKALELWSAGSLNATLDASGRLGIGTASPGTALDVHQSVSTAYSASALNTSIARVYNSFASAGDTASLLTFGAANYGSLWTIGSVESTAVGNYGGALIFQNRTGASTAAERMRLDASGNLGLGVTPSAWASGWEAMQFAFGTGLASALGGDFNVVNNAIFDSTDNRWEYHTSTVGVSRYRQNFGTHEWYTAASGTAGNAITFTQAMTLDASGNLGVGTTSPDRRLDVEESVAGQAGARINNTSTANSSGVETVLELYNNVNAMARVSSFRDTNELRINNIANGIASFYTNNTERARITSAGSMVVGTAAIATTATDGFLYVPTCAGTPTGTPTTQTGTAPIVVDTTNNKLYFYSGGSWRDAGP